MQHDAVVDVVTAALPVFMNNPRVRGIYLPNSPIDKTVYDKIISLDGAYERHPRSHICEAYAKEAFGNLDGLDLSPEIFPAPADIDLAADILSKIQVPFVAIHARRHAFWPARNIAADFWQSLANTLLSETNLSIVFLGNGADLGPDRNTVRVFNLVQQLSLHQTFEIIRHAKGFVGADSGIMHLASCTRTPIVGLFSSALPEFRFPLRSPSSFVGVAADVDCVGCQHDEPPPIFEHRCRRTDYACVNAFSVHATMQGLVQLAVV